MWSKILVIAAVLGAVTAQIPAIAKRDFIENRQVDNLSLDPACQSALSMVQTLYLSEPTPPADLESVTLPADPCVTPSFTGTLQSEWVSYTSELFAWVSSHTTEIDNFITACSSLVGEAATAYPVCSSDVTGLVSAATTAAATTSAAATSAAATSAAASSAAASSAAATTSAHTTAASETSTPHATTSHAVSSAGASTSASPSSAVPTTNAAPRETGFVVAAAVAVAGFMGAVAVL
ncbi:hypothetical protein F4823DRAFT_632559 [Ustulina deusta]|nr:hypothetical protein F4823DRAFT_632559 [Ustulina deusta]